MDNKLYRKYGHSIRIHKSNVGPATATEMVDALTQYNLIEAWYSRKLLAALDPFMQLHDEVLMASRVPEWTQKLMKKWGLR